MVGTGAFCNCFLQFEVLHVLTRICIFVLLAASFLGVRLWYRGVVAGLSEQSSQKLENVSIVFLGNKRDRQERKESGGRRQGSAGSSRGQMIKSNFQGSLYLFSPDWQCMHLKSL